MKRFKLLVTDYNYGDLEIEKNAIARMEKEKNVKIELASAQCRNEDDMIKEG
ncbi:hypothetical protein H5U35_01295, partial [Candidatus Aerophobetes bacterium]|nr:hypothetical protein [Candidatus Aerophobetes bacterium]